MPKKQRIEFFINNILKETLSLNTTGISRCQMNAVATAKTAVMLKVIQAAQCFTSQANDVYVD
jgi:hypothetical protein